MKLGNQKAQEFAHGLGFRYFNNRPPTEATLDDVREKLAAWCGEVASALGVDPDNEILNLAHRGALQALAVMASGAEAIEIGQLIALIGFQEKYKEAADSEDVMMKKEQLASLNRELLVLLEAGTQ